MPELSDFPPEVQQYLKANGIDPHDLVPADELQSGQPEGMSKTGAAAATLKAHAGGILGGGVGTLAGVALAPETAGLSLLVPIAAGLAGSYAGQKAQGAILPDETNQRLQQEAEQAQQEHPWVTLGTDVTAGALASGGRLSPGTIRRALTGDMGALGNIALQSGINTAIDTGVQSAQAGKLQLPTGRELLGDIAGGALFSEPSSLGRMAHRTSSEPLPEVSPNQTVETPSISQDVVGPLKMATPTPTGEVSPAPQSETGVVAKTKDTVTQNKMEDTTVTPQNPIDKKEQTVGPSGLTKAEEDALKGVDVNELPQTTPLPEKFVPQKYSDEDLQKYNELNGKMKELSSTIEGVQSPEFGDVWKQFEDVRNKYGGMPPEQKGQQIVEPRIYDYVDEKYLQSEKDLKLQDVLEHNADVFKQYPYLKDLDVKYVSSNNPALRGEPAKMITLGNGEGTMFLSKQHWDDAFNGNDLEARKHLESAMLHEAAHAVQDREGTLEGYGHDEKVTDFSEKFASDFAKKWSSKKPYTKEETVNAIQKPSTEEVLSREQTPTDTGGSERTGVGQSIEGTKAPTESPKEEVVKPSEETAQKMKEAVTVPPQKEVVQEVPKNKFLAKTWAVIDKVHDLNHPGAAPLADSAKLALNKADQYRGEWVNSTVEAGDKLTSAERVQLQKIMDTEMSTKQLHPEMANTPNLKRFYDLAKRNLSNSADRQIDVGEPVYSGNNPRPLKKVPWYWPGMADQKAEQVYRDATDQKAIAAQDAAFDKWNQQALGLSPERSQQLIDNFKTAVQGNRNSNEVSHQDVFKASRRAMGEPLPPELREKDPVKNLTRYFDRKALDLAHYEHIEKNPQAMAALGEKNDAWGKPVNFSYKEGSLAGNGQVRALIKQFRPDIEPESQRTLNATGSLVTNLLINGPTLEMHKIVSNQVGMIGQADNPYQMARAVGHALTHINEGWEHAKAGGLVKLSASSSLDMFNGAMNAATRLNGLSKVIRDVSTLGGLTTKLNAGLMQSYFESLVPSKVIRANRGDVDAQRFVRRLDPTYTPGKIYQSADMVQLASIAAKYIHGTGDIRTMPAFMMRDNEIKGFLELAHWSVSQTTKFQHDIWEPAKRGNYAPLMTGIFGATVGGYIIKQLREELSGKKSNIPSLTEIANSERGIAGNAGPLMYNAIAAMQYAGFGGLLSQVAKYPFDVVYKNTPQGATFPLDQIASDLAVTTGQVASAIANDPNLNWVDLAKAVSMHILQSDIQLSRTAINQGINAGVVTGLPAEKKMLSDKMNELRRYDMVSGLPYNDIDQGSNPFMNIEQQKFKHDSNVGEAVQMIPQLLNGIIQRYGSQPDLMLQKIKALKQNMYDTMPSMESTPMQFFKYLQYLGRTEGPEKAQEMLTDYMRHTIGNRIKSGIVP